MRGPITLLAALVASALSQAAGVTKLDSPPKPEWVTVKADPLLTTLSVDKAAKWILIDDGPQCDLRPAADGKTATFAATVPGRYRVLVVAGEEVFRVAVQVPDVPQPMPPDPKPPVPPTPPTPPPADPLVKVLQAAYDADTRAAKDKESDRLDLVELYRQASTLALDPSVTTTGQLVARVRDAAKALGIVGLSDCRKAIAGELQAAFPEDAPLTADSRKKAADLFGRIKAALEGVK